MLPLLLTEVVLEVGLCMPPPRSSSYTASCTSSRSCSFRESSCSYMRRLSHSVVFICHLRGRAQMPPLVLFEVVPECRLAYPFEVLLVCRLRYPFEVMPERCLRGRARMSPRVPFEIVLVRRLSHPFEVVP
ncbi:hypothetical protein B0H13DRAFT_2329178 [Mycena leptocephala]|nr:hypothetical protein B0H13DRAFT_2329178 [Mycena leptocephala]